METQGRQPILGLADLVRSWPERLHDEARPWLAPARVNRAAARERARSHKGFVKDPSKITLQALEVFPPKELWLYLGLIGGRVEVPTTTRRQVRNAKVLGPELAEFDRKLDVMQQHFSSIDTDGDLSVRSAIELVRFLCSTTAESAQQLPLMETVAEALQKESVTAAVRKHFLRALRNDLVEWKLSQLARLLYASRTDWRVPPCPAFATKSEATIYALVRSDLTRMTVKERATGQPPTSSPSQPPPTHCPSIVVHRTAAVDTEMNSAQPDRSRPTP